MKRFWVIVLAVLPAALFFACRSGEDPSETSDFTAPATEDGAVGTTVTPGHATGACHAGVEGCACSDDGARAACGLITRTNGDYEICTPGYATCTSGVWSVCEGDRDVVHGRAPIHAAGPVDSGAADASADASIDAAAVGTGSCLSPCDPYCAVAPTPPLPASSGGLSVLDGGSITVVPFDAGVPDSGMNCTAGGSTIITGVVHDPAGINPLYNATVYIPTSPLLPAISTGASSDSCTSTLAAKAVTTTAADGSFTLTGVPAGTNIPIVVQVGKWRRELIISTVPSCVTSAFSALTCAAGTPAGACNLRLPQSHTDGWNASASSWGAANIPHIAMVSGIADPLECMLLKAGVSTSEFGAYPAAAPRIHYYTSPYAAGAALAPAFGSNVTSASLESSLTQLEGYDAVIYSCEGGTKYRSSSSVYANELAYANAGGRLFLTHYSYTWIQQVSAWNVVTGSWYSSNAPQPWYLQPVTSFPKGAVFSTWLSNAGAKDASGYLEVDQGRYDYAGVQPNVQIWMKDSSGNPGSFTYNTPYSATTAGSNGRVVFTNYHASATALTCDYGTGDVRFICPSNACSTDADCGYTVTCQSNHTCSPLKANNYFPNECIGGPLSPQESALEFMFFDLTSCVSVDTTPPPPPTLIFSSQTFTQDYTATCQGGTSPQWREVDWQAAIPSGAEVDFSVQTGASFSSLTPSSPLPVAAATTSTALPGFDLAYIDTGTTGTGAFNLQNPPIVSRQVLRLTVTLSPSGTQSPLLNNWKVLYDCVPSQ